MAKKTRIADFQVLAAANHNLGKYLKLFKQWLK